MTSKNNFSISSIHFFSPFQIETVVRNVYNSPYVKIFTTEGSALTCFYEQGSKVSQYIEGLSYFSIWVIGIAKSRPFCTILVLFLHIFLQRFQCIDKTSVLVVFSGFSIFERFSQNFLSQSMTIYVLWWFAAKDPIFVLYTSNAWIIIQSTRSAKMCGVYSKRTIHKRAP